MQFCFKSSILIMLMFMLICLLLKVLMCWGLLWFVAYVYIKVDDDVDVNVEVDVVLGFDIMSNISLQTQHVNIVAFYVFMLVLVLYYVNVAIVSGGWIVNVNDIIALTLCFDFDIVVVLCFDVESVAVLCLECFLWGCWCWCCCVIFWCWYCCVWVVVALCEHVCIFVVVLYFDVDIVVSGFLLLLLFKIVVFFRFLKIGFLLLLLLF